MCDQPDRPAFTRGRGLEAGRGGVEGSLSHRPSKSLPSMLKVRLKSKMYQALPTPSRCVERHPSSDDFTVKLFEGRVASYRDLDSGSLITPGYYLFHLWFCVLINVSYLSATIRI